MDRHKRLFQENESADQWLKEQGEKTERLWGREKKLENKIHI